MNKPVFLSEVSPLFINPYPITIGSCCTIKAKSIAGTITKAILVMVLQGATTKIRMKKITVNDAIFDVFEAVIDPVPSTSWYHWFQLETSNGYWFATRRGIQPFHPTKEKAYFVDPQITIPSWVPGGTFYQILPDRFRTSGKYFPNDGTWEFDGHTVKRLEFGEVPPAYKDGWCLDFYGGDLPGIVQSIEYLKELGVTAVYINPIFMARTNHRYDCINYFSVDPHLGGNEALFSLIEQLHREDMHVILDVSINHTGIDHPWSTAKPQWYYVKEDGTLSCWAGVHTLPQLNYRSDSLREVMYRNPHSVVRKWLNGPSHIDGWRFDVATETGRQGTDQFCHEIWRQVRNSVVATAPDSYIIGEAWEDASEYLQGDMWHSAMNYFGSGRLLRRWCGLQDSFLTNDWGHSDESGRPLSGYELSLAIEQHLMAIADQLVPLQYNLIDSHDTPRLHNHANLFNWEVYRGAIMLLFLLPGVPSIYYGDEIGLAGTIESNEGARYSMQWDPLCWDERYFALYRSLGSLRRQHTCLAWGGFSVLGAGDDSLVFARWDHTEALILVLNRSADASMIQFDVSSLGIISAVYWESNEPVKMVQGLFSVPVHDHNSKLLVCTVHK